MLNTVFFDRKFAPGPLTVTTRTLIYPLSPTPSGSRPTNDRTCLFSHIDSTYIVHDRKSQGLMNVFVSKPVSCTLVPYEARDRELRIERYSIRYLER